MSMPKPLSPVEVDLLLEQIALDHLFIETLVTQHSDRLDFHEVSVWAVKTALQAAYQAGQRARCETHCAQAASSLLSKPRRIRSVRPPLAA